jgi:transposase
MSLHIQPVPPVPEETARIAHAAFPNGNPLLTLRDELGIIFSDQSFAHLYPTRGQPAEAPWRLALVTVLQFAEHLSV